MEAPGRLIVKAMLNGVQNGRQGKGSIFVFASGNGGAVDDQCNFDGYTNSLMSITVGAIDRKGLHPFYSEACSANMVVTFSSGSGDNIVRFLFLFFLSSLLTLLSIYSTPLTSARTPAPTATVEPPPPLPSPPESSLSSSKLGTLHSPSSSLLS
jgi:hypothetical protein